MKIKQTIPFFGKQSAAQQRFAAKIKTWKENCVIILDFFIIVSSSSTFIVLSNIFLSQFLQVKPNFYFYG